MKRKKKENGKEEGETLEDMGSGVVRTSRTGTGRLRGWGWWGGIGGTGVV